MNVLFFKHSATLRKEFFRLAHLILCFLTYIASGGGLQNQTRNVFEFRFLDLGSGVQGVLDLLKYLVELVASESLLSFVLVAEGAAPEFYPGHVNVDHFFDVLFCFKSGRWSWSFPILKSFVFYLS